jgi:hypothetical protein
MPELRPRRLIISGEWGLPCLFLLRATRCHIIVNSILVIRAVSDNGGKRLLDLVQHGFELGGIVGLLAGQG